MDFLGGSDSKEPACNSVDPGSIPGSGRSPGEVNGNPLQYSCLENYMDRWLSMGSQRVGHNWATNIFTWKHFDVTRKRGWNSYKDRIVMHYL